MMGGPTAGTAGACMDLGIRGIYVRHEQAAAMMAHAYARVTGKPGICIAPMGPGVVNLMTGLGNAWADASPVIAIGGCAPIGGTTLDTFQEMDQVPMMRPIVKAAYRVDLAIASPSTSLSRFARPWMASAGRSISIYQATCFPPTSRKTRFIGSRVTRGPTPVRPAIRRWCVRR